jgi:hypothetical protein
MLFLLLMWFFYATGLCIFYSQEAANPVLIDGMYDFHGLCANSCSFLYHRFYGGKTGPRLFPAVFRACYVFCIISLANVDSIAYALFYIVLIVRLFTGTVMFLRNSPLKKTAQLRRKRF